MRPNSILRFEQLYLGSVAVGLVSVALSWEAMRAALAADPAIAQLGMSGGLISAALALSIGFSLLLWFLIARRASTIGKWLLVLLTVFGIVMLPATLSAAAGVSATLVLSLASTALQVAAVWFLFRPDAREWLASKGRVAPTDSSVFD